MVVFCVLSFGPLASASDTSALSAQIETVRKEREALLSEQARLQAELEKTTAEGKNLGSAVKSLDATKKKIANDIKITQSKINSANLNIQVLQNNVNAAERDISTHHSAISTALQRLSEYDERPLWLDILASTSFSEIWSDKSQLASLNDDLEGEVDDLRETKEVLTQEKEKKERVKEQAETLAKELSGQKSVVEESQKAKEKLLAETKSKEALYQQLLAENRAKEKQFEDDLFRLESELKITLDPALIPTARTGVLSWPVDKVRITTRFGTVSGAALRIYASGSHNGVDFGVPQGTPVKSVMSGVVQGTGNTDEQKGCGSYGRWILVKHPNGLSSIYGHLSASLVQTGQAVQTGQVIGYSGGTPGVFGSGYSTGPHLHLGLFASQGVIVRQFTESRGCKQVIVPIADVRAYLDPLAYLPSL